MMGKMNPRMAVAMAQHFLLSARARTLSLAKVLRMSDRDAETVFAAIRWADTAGKPVCPRCACATCYDCRRPNGAPRWRCKACREQVLFFRCAFHHAI